MELAERDDVNQGEPKRETAADNENTRPNQSFPTTDRDDRAVSPPFDSITIAMPPSAEKSPIVQQKPKEKKPFVKPKDEVTYMTHLTTLAHVSVLVFVYIVIKLAFRDDFVLFTWHPILMGLGWMLLMTQGLFAINKYNTYWRFKTTGGFRVKIHWLTLSIGYTLSVVGFAIVYINKNLHNKHHFVTWHGLFGLIALVSTLPPIINGTVLLYKKELSRFIDKPRLVKFIHVTSGTLSFFFGALALILSVYSKWYTKRSKGADYIFWLGLVSASYPLFWAVFGPSVKLARVIREYFGDKED